MCIRSRWWPACRVGAKKPRAPRLITLKEREAFSRVLEKANDRLVARRQKRKGMAWSLASSESLGALRTVVLNGGWDAYWAERRVLPLAA